MKPLPLGKATREAFGEVLAELGETRPDIVVLDGDLSKSTKTSLFAKKFPDRFFNCGIAEANMIGVAAGLAMSGKVPFAASFACFLLCKGYDQIRMSVAYSELNVKLVGSHGGISIGEDGASQMSIEDYALATSFPGMTVLSPADETATRALVPQVAEKYGAVYLRLCRGRAKRVYPPGKTDFSIGRAEVLREGGDAAIFACGLEVAEALEAAEALSGEGIEAAVVDFHTLKPIDEEMVVSWAKRTGAVVTAEEHQIYGGLGSIVARLLAQQAPVPCEFVAIQDTYAESGDPKGLFEKYGLSARYIAAAVKRAVSRKT